MPRRSPKSAGPAPVPAALPTEGVKALSERLAEAFGETPKLRIETGDRLADALRQGGVGDFEAHSELAACLLPLLNAVGWRGSMREISEALPHFANGLDLIDLQNVMAHLGYEMRELCARLSDLDLRLLPCLLIDAAGHAALVLGREAEGYRLYDAVRRDEVIDPDAGARTGRVFLIRPISAPDAGEKKASFVANLAWRFRPTLWALLGLSFALNLLSLVVPLFTMTVYDQVIPSQSVRVLVYLVAGVGLAFLAEMALRLLRAKLIAYVGGRLEHIVATSTFGQILALPIPLTEGAPVGAQAARIKEFDSIRDLFTGPMVAVGLELPFVLLFLLVIAWLGGPLAWIPGVLILVYVVIGLSLLPGLRRSVSQSSRARAERHGFLVEMLTHARAIKQLAAEDNWIDRYRKVSAEASFAHFRTAQMSFFLQTIAQAIMMAAGIGTVAFGTLRVMAGDMTVGALIATMALVWRVLSPLQGLFLALTRFEQAKQALAQINMLMRMPREHRDRRARKVARDFAGAVAFERVSFRYRPDAEPALAGVSFRVAPGEMLAVMGPNGAGKSTILTLAAGLYRPQAGLVTIDNIDIRQMDPVELRQDIAYVPQDSHIFHGSIAQNLRLGHPTATDDDLERVCDDLGILDAVMELPEGFDTRFGDQRVEQLNVGFKQSIAIARALLRKPTVLLLDEAARALDFEADGAFTALLERLRGKATVLMVTHRPSHIKMCDKAIILKGGMIVGAGKSEEILASLSGGTI